MALILNDFELKDKTLLPNAYARVINVVVNNADYEFYENNPNVGEDGIEQFLRFGTEITSTALVYVYADKEARDNNVPPLEWFSINVPYNLESTDNVFTQAYTTLKQRYPNSNLV